MESLTNPRDLNELQSKIGYCFDDISILKEALTHSSARNYDNKAKTNERLEWLGDAILHQVCSVYLVLMNPKDCVKDLHNKRQLLENNNTLDTIADELQLRKYIFFDQSVGRKDYKCCDFVESLIGAIYSDASARHGSEDYGRQVVVQFIEKFWDIKIGKFEKQKSNCVIL